MSQNEIKNDIVENSDSQEDLNPYKDINLTKRHAIILNKNGDVIYDKHVTFPEYYTDNSVNIVASKYLCKDEGKEEDSLIAMVDRVSDTITNYAKESGYSNYEVLNYNLKYHQSHQNFAFNSPVYFNVGIRDKPQASACFIVEIEDSMESIFDAGKAESIIFKWGSGSGMNISKLRSSKEKVRGGGYASGPVSFFRAHDVSAGVIKSGGTLRRSAKIVCMDDSHPDLLQFIKCKEIEERKLKAIADAGIEAVDGFDMTDHVFFQNTNISVSLSDEFIQAAIDGRNWSTRYVLSGEPCETFDARELLMEIAKSAHNSGDPGIQYKGNINKWNSVTNTGKIRSSNPCGEYFAPDNTSCNLASINVLNFFNFVEVAENDTPYFTFDYDKFESVIRTAITAQDLLVDNSAYPTRKIANMTTKLRALGLGYSNIAATLMWLGLPYDSDEGREFVSLITSLMTGIAFRVSSELADELGPFKEFENNKEHLYKVLNQHKSHVDDLVDTVGMRIYDRRRKKIFSELSEYVSGVWEYLTSKNREYRNSQVTLIAPTGTTSFMMGCDSTGSEPFFSLLTYKTLAGSGSTITLTNPIVAESLKNLGYNDDQIESCMMEVRANGTIENCTTIDEKHIPIFDCAVACGSGRYIDYNAHIKMLKSIQPFISGGISKTVNMHNDCSIGDIYNLIIDGWKYGLKGFTIYRDGSRSVQVLSNKKKVSISNKRNRLPGTIQSSRHKFEVNGTEVFLHPGMYEDGTLGELFIRCAKQGSTLNGFLDSIGILTSIGLQHTNGAILRDFVEKLKNQKFEPSGFVKTYDDSTDDDIKMADSIIDYIFKWLGKKYLPEKDQFELGLITEYTDDNGDSVENECMIDYDRPPCEKCGAIMTRKGTCYWCNNCGENKGGCSL